MSRQAIHAGVLSAIVAALLIAAPPVRADDAAIDATVQDIGRTLGGVPVFTRDIAKAGLPGLWQQVKSLTLSDQTALSAKEKALISLAVSAQIPCGYCIWSDTRDARRAGASDEEIREAVAVAGLTRQMSTLLNGMQVDLATYKKDLGGDAPAAKQEE